MSAWRLVTVALHHRGGSGTAQQLRRDLHLDGSAISTALNRARRLGVVEKQPRGKPGQLWSVTQLGHEFIAGRARQVETRPGGRRWVPVAQVEGTGAHV
jgi:DNA-binding MarR family transcriptional regulator